jgi:hypothetical protein
MPSLGGRRSLRGTGRVGGTAGLCVLPVLHCQVHRPPSHFLLQALPVPSGCVSHFHRGQFSQLARTPLVCDPLSLAALGSTQPSLQNTLWVLCSQHLLQVGVSPREGTELAKVDQSVFVGVHTRQDPIDLCVAVSKALVAQELGDPVSNWSDKAGAHALPQTDATSSSSIWSKVSECCAGMPSKETIFA